jgi:hypothetical protein
MGVPGQQEAVVVAVADKSVAADHILRCCILAMAVATETRKVDCTPETLRKKVVVVAVAVARRSHRRRTVVFVVHEQLPIGPRTSHHHPW